MPEWSVVKHDPEPTRLPADPLPGGPTDTTMTLIMYLNKQLYSKNYGMGGALSVLLFIVTGILSLIVFKAFAQKKEA